MMKPLYFIPLIVFLVSTIIISYLLIPREMKIIISFSVCLFFMSITYITGIYLAVTM